MAEHMNIGQQSNNLESLLTKVKETMELITTFVNMFLTTREGEYIDTAIALVTELTTFTLAGFQYAPLEDLIVTLTDVKAGRRDPSSVVFGSRGEVPAEGTREVANSPSAAYQLSSLYTKRYDECGGREELEKAIQQTEEALEEGLAGDHNRQIMLCELGRLAHARFERLGFVDDLEKSIQRTEEALAATPADHPDRVATLANLGRSLCFRYERLGTLQDLEDAIQRTNEALAAIPADHPDRAGRLANLGGYLNSRYKRLGNLQDLEDAIQWTHEALAATPVDHPDRARSLANLGCNLSSRYGRLVNLQDLEDAIQWTNEALAATPAEHPDRAGRLANLGGYLNSRYGRLGNLQDLEDAIQWTNEALAATPADHPDRAGRLANLGSDLGSRYGRLGNLQDLEDAIQWTNEALAATPADHPDRACRLANLGSDLGSRYGRLGNLQDLEDAVQWTNEALAVFPADHPDRARSLANLSNNLSSRYGRLGNLQDLEDAIQWTNEALAVFPADHPDRARSLANLGNNLGSRYGRLGNLQDLEDAIQRTNEALAATPADHPNRAGILSTLSLCLNLRYSQLGTLQDLDDVLTLAKEVVAMTPANHPNQGHYLAVLGASALRRYTHTHNEQDLLYALGIIQDAWNCSLSGPVMRIKLACVTANILFDLGRWQESSSLLEDAVKLLPTVSPRFLRRNDQEHKLSEISGTAAEAISAALAAGQQASHCLTLLELGRGVINGLTIDYRSDISELKSKNPAVFERFDHLRIELDFRSEYDKTTHEQVSKRRMEAAKELEETLVNIRQLPGFSGFQSPPNPKDLMAAAEEGSIIVVNCSSYRSDAIIVLRSVIKSLPLPLLTHDGACTRMKDLRENMIRGLNSTYRTRNRALNQFLLWLWTTVVGPIFQELQLNPVAEGSTPPRIWWIGVGPLSMAPFHAAGDHSEGSTDNTISRAISSYISTIKALSFAREKSLELLSRADSKVLLIAMPTTPEEMPLGSASTEVSDIARSIEQSMRATVLEHPSASEVLEKLQSCEAVHFACHGITDARNPSNSRLLLFKDNGSAAATADPLTVEKMSSTRIKTAQIAYLSACSTVDNVSAKLADESIHIASGFQLAGFSHVLGTMWKSNDVACREVAVAFYRSLLDGQGDKGHSKVSLSFHQAVKELRQKRLRQPIIWSSFIHTGA